MSKLIECVDELSPVCDAIRSKYDIRLVLAALGSQLATTAAAAMAGGVSRRYVSEIVAGTLDAAYTPLEKKPIVHYFDGEESLGRKN